MTIDESLLATDVNLALRAGDKSAAIDEVLGLVRGDSRVGSWERLRAAVLTRDAPALEHAGHAICIAHGRTDAVTGLIVAAGRSEHGILCAETNIPVHLVFVAGIPSAMNSEYLRLVGAIARVCSNAAQMDGLLAAADGQTFVEHLAAATERL